MKRSLQNIVLGAGILILASSGFLPSVTGQDQTDQQRRSDIGERQRLVEQKMAELETKFEITAQKLEAKEPERAKRLIEALQQAKSKLISRKMKEIRDLLDAEKLNEAELELNAVILNLEELVRLLLNEKDESMSRQQEIEMLKKWKEQIEKIKKEQNQQTRETSKIANKDDTLKTLEQQIKQIEALIKRQQTVNQEATENRTSGLQALDRIADKQFDVRKDTEDLAKELSGEDQKPKPTDEDQADQGQQSSDKQGKPSDEQGKPSDEQGKPSDEQGQPSSSGQSAGDKQPKPSQKQQGQKQNEQPSQPKQPGQQPLEQAAEHQKSSEQDLAAGKAAKAKGSGEKALDELKKALAELKKEERRIASLPPEAFDKMARDQRRTRDKTADVAKEMKNAPKPGQGEGQPENKQANSQQPKPQSQPGQQSVERAQKAMQNASGDLSEQDPQRAERQQKKAEEELEKALREIEERLDQLRKETREEKLARLEARFREMLARQQIASVMTIDLDDKKTHLGRLKRRDVLTMLKLATEEFEISELGQQAYDLLLEDGTSIVFSETVQNVREDLVRVSQMLESEQTGPLTQLIQGEIESTLEELLEALKKTRKEGGGGGGGGGGGNQPLLSKTAELKMLQSAQLRVNRLTKQFDLIRPNGKLGEMLDAELGKIRGRQANIVEMMIRIMEKE